MNYSLNDSDSIQNLTFSASYSLTRYVTQCLYVAAGSACVLGNLLVIVVVCRNKKLQGKIFLLLVNLAFADVLKGMAYLLAGSKRLWLLHEGGDRTLVSSFDCMQEISTTLFILGPQAINLMTIIVSFDRFVAIAFPLFYSKLSKTYIWYCIFSCWLAVSASYCAAWLESSRLTNAAKYSRWCVASWSFSPAYNGFMFGFEAFSTWICFILLVATILALRCPRTVNTASVGRPSYYKRQLKVARMVLISLSFLIVLWVLPTNIVFVMTLVGRSRTFDMHLAPALWLMVAFSGCTNVFVYAWLNKRIRAGIKQLLFRCRTKTYFSVLTTQNLRHPKPSTASSRDLQLVAARFAPIMSSGMSSNYQDL